MEYVSDLIGCDDCADYWIEAVYNKKFVLSIEERNLFSISQRKRALGFKQSIEALLTICFNLEDDSQRLIGRDYILVILSRYSAHAHQCLAVLAKIIATCHGNKSSDSSIIQEFFESVTFYNKMLGDYYCHLAEIELFTSKVYEMPPIVHSTTTSNLLTRLPEIVSYAAACYDRANESAKNLSPNSLIRLSLALNHSIFLHNLLKSERSTGIAKIAFDLAMAELATAGIQIELDQNTLVFVSGSKKVDQYNGSLYLLQRIRDNLQKWSSEQDDGDGFTGNENVEIQVAERDE